MGITVTLTEISNNGPKQRAIAEKACELLQSALNHPGFRAKIEGMYYEQTRFTTASGEGIEVPVDKIYDYLLSGAEMGTPSDGIISIEVSLKCFKEGVLGSTTLGRPPFFTSYWFINSCIANDDARSLAAHFMHEWLHIAGFYHFPDNSARNDVAYNVGNAVKELLDEELSSSGSAQSKQKSEIGNGGLGAEFLEDSMNTECGQCGETPEDISVAEEKALKN